MSSSAFSLIFSPFYMHLTGRKTTKTRYCSLNLGSKQTKFYVNKRKNDSKNHESI